MEVTPTISIDIWQIEAEFQRDEKDNARKKPVDVTPVVDVEALEFNTAELVLDVGINFSLPSLHSSSILLISAEA